MYEVRFPDYLTGYELETEAKGCLVGVQVVSPLAVYDLTIYDPVRLGQDVAAEVESDGYFTETNLVVVPRVTREDITRAVAAMAQCDFAGLKPEPAQGA
ncbi:hypothetical protein AB5J55_43680 [Streptomyces sp. R11]|uniref:Uncharacterized protein n=1 Tax=Streptomyces sp. R11 TaxID=3238625 RepID=A0AB39NCL6_9ACTN